MPAERKSAPKTRRTFYIEASILAVFLISAVFVFDAISPQRQIQTAAPRPSPANAIFEGTGPVEPFNLKYMEPLEAGTYKITLFSDYPVGITLFPSFQDLLSFAQMEKASYYSGCEAQDTTSVTLECDVFSGAFVAVYNSGNYTASVSLVIDETEPSYTTGFAVKKIIGIATPRNSFSVGALQ